MFYIRHPTICPEQNEDEIALSNQKYFRYIAPIKKNAEISTFTILSHISFAVTLLSSDKPKHGNTLTLTFCVSHAAIAKVTGGLPFAVLEIDIVR